MIIRKAFKYRLRVARETALLLRQFAGCRRFVWNKALAMQKELLESGKPRLSYGSLALLLPKWKKESPFLAQAPSQPLQQTLMDLDRSLKDAFDRNSPKRFPVFKKKNRSTDSLRYPQGFKLDGDRALLPKLGWLRFHRSRPVTGTPANITVSRRGQHWYISIQTEQTVPAQIHPSSSIAGIDRGIARFITLSDGSHYAPLNVFRRLEHQLAKEQRRLARKKKHSSNWRKQKERITRLHIRIADTRRDYLHKISAAVSKKHAVVVMENLKVANMSASAKSKGAPRRRTRQKAGLNKAILDQGWFEFQRQVTYKLLWRGGRVVLVNPAHTSQRCRACGHTSCGNRVSQSSFVCEKCGHTANADHNAAENILAAGHAVLACGEFEVAISLIEAGTTSLADNARLGIPAPGAGRMPTSDCSARL